VTGGGSKKILLGRIGAAHGIRGEVRLQSFTQNPVDIATYGPLETDKPGVSITISTLRPQKDPQKEMMVARLAGIGDRTAAEKLNGIALYIERERLPMPDTEDDFYHTDLIGLEARLPDGTVLGTVSAVPNFGADDLLEVKDERTGDTFLYPFTRAVVPQVHLSDGYLTLVPPLDAEPGEEEPD